MMRMLRSAAAVAAGYGVMSMALIGGSILVARLFAPAELRTGADGGPSFELPAVYVAASLVTGALAAVMGGWVAARFAAFAPFGHAVALAAIVAALTVASEAAMPRGSSPGVYSAVAGAVTVAGVLVGGKLRAAAAAARGPVVA
jgi:hypothetical protein